MRRIATFTACAALVASLFSVFVQRPAIVSAAPISCGGRAYMVRSTVSGTNSQQYSQLYEFSDTGSSISLNNMFNSAGGGLTIGGTNINNETTYPNGFILNGLAYSPQDQYMYVAKNNGPTNPDVIYRINNDGSLDQVATASGSVTASIKGAAITPTGIYYGMSNDGVGTHLNTITGLSTAPGTPAVVQPQIQLSQRITMGDLVYDYTDNTLYAIDNDDGRLYVVNPTTGVVSPVSASVSLGAGVSLGTNGIGSMFMTATGGLRGYINNDSSDTKGMLVDINKTTNRITHVKDGQQTINSDGTSCVPSGFNIDTVKSADSVSSVSETEFNVAYTVKVGNTGPVADTNVQAVDNLALTFATGSPAVVASNLQVTSGGCTANTGFNGLSDIRLLAGTDTLAAGAACTMTFMVNLKYNDAASVPKDQQLNTVLASTTATGPNAGHSYASDGTVVEPFNILAADTSTDGPGLPGSANGDSPRPTPVTLATATPALANTGLSQILTIGMLSCAVAIGLALSRKYSTR